MIKMKKQVVIALGAAAVVLAAAVVVVGIGIANRNTAKQVAQRNEYERALLGKWAYVHDPKKAVATFKANGRAKFEGEKYNFSCDGEYISFVGEEIVRQFRYAFEDGHMYLYRKNKYVLENGGSPDGIVGVWVCKETNWSFEFTSKGTFMEDSVLTGHYFINEEDKTIRLYYEGMLPDTVFYYELTDDGLYVEYPWEMVKL